LRGTKAIHLAPLGVDESLFSPDSSKTGQRIVHAGTLVPVKDQATLLRAFGLLRQEVPDACLEIVGDGPLLGELQQLAAHLRLDGSVRFRGAVDHADLAAIYRGAGLCVVSSRHEAQCMVALEAAACGVPVAGTRVGVLPELTSAVAPVANAPALARAMIAALSAPPQTSDELAKHFGLIPCTARFRALYAKDG
jgi:glycosyltransferase involved in cell wall biosynthesis